MAKAVFTTRVDPTYDDLPETHYHFPDIKGYLATAEAAVGDWIIYYEPSRRNEQIRDGRSAYFATARVTSIKPDPGKPNHFYAYLQDYLEFPRPVPFKEGEHFYERALGKPDGATDSFAFRSAMRPIADLEYEEILRSGFLRVRTSIGNEAYILPMVRLATMNKSFALCTGRGKLTPTPAS